MNNIFANLTTIKGFGNNHTPTEIQRRLLFASHFKQALASGEHFADQKRNRIKSLDEYYSIRAQIKHNVDTASCDNPRSVKTKALLHRQKPPILVLVALLSFYWLNFITNMIGFGPITTYPLMPITWPVRLGTSIAASSLSICTTCLASILKIFFAENDVARMPFIPKHKLPTTPKSMSALEQIAKHRACAIVENTLLEAKDSFRETENAKLVVLDNASRYLYNISSVVDGSSIHFYDAILPFSKHDNGKNDNILTPLSVNGVETEEVEAERKNFDVNLEKQDQLRTRSTNQKLINAIESSMQALTDKATGVTFEPKLDEEQYLVGVGVRKKSIINVYAVAMYSFPAVLEALAAFPKGHQQNEVQVALRDAARTFDVSTQTTTFVLSMVYKADAKTIAAAIADGVKPRYHGNIDNVEYLEKLISEGVNSKGGYATKGTILRFDCSAQGIGVSIDGNKQGDVLCGSIGSALVDVFTDDEAVSPRLIDSCTETWSGSEIALLLKNAETEEVDKDTKQIEEALPSNQKLINAIESSMQALTDKATGVTFEPKLDEEQYLVGVGVRKKSIINVYAVAMYSFPAVLEALAAFPKGHQQNEVQVALRDAARTFDVSTQTTTFVLSMVYKADAKTIAAAIADGVKPRYHGNIDNVEYLEKLISEGVNSKGGYATKGTILRFDCSAQGIGVSIDGNKQGDVLCGSIGSALVDVFTDDEAVSPRLIDSCTETWSGKEHVLQVT